MCVDGPDTFCIQEVIKAMVIHIEQVGSRYDFSLQLFFFLLILFLYFFPLFFSLFIVFILYLSQLYFSATKGSKAHHGWMSLYQLFIVAGGRDAHGLISVTLKLILLCCFH